MVEAETRATAYRGLVFGVLAPPIAWAVLHMFDYVWIETACQTGILSATFAGLTGVAWVVAVATLVALAVVAVAGITSYRRFQALNEPEDGERSTVEERSRFLALSGVMVSALFALLVLMTGLPVLFMSPCLGMP